MNLEIQIAQTAEKILQQHYQLEIVVEPSVIQKTRKEFKGNFTLVLFPYLKSVKKSLDDFAKEFGQLLTQELDFIEDFNCIKGFLNLSVKSDYWIDFVKIHSEKSDYGIRKNDDGDTVLIEFSSPNTNKPLHLGHIRNNLLGASVSRIIAASGKKVIRVNLVNDRGIHICKSMLAWLKYGNGETPETSGLKGDHLVGKYYVEFDKRYKEEIEGLKQNGYIQEVAEKRAFLILEAQSMLRRWEQNDEEMVSLWKMMNGWVYQGFEQTYKNLGIEFDLTQYESETYLLGKQLVEEGLQTGAFYKKPDGSVWADLTELRLDQKLLLRSDGTAVYMTQDLGTAQLRYEKFKPSVMIYVVGNEQEYHFDALKLILGKKLNRDFGQHIFHLSYGMVELPSGKMKSREGTVVDADDLMEEMILQATQNTERLGKTEFEPEEKRILNRMIGLGALKYFILKVDPKKNMLFNPQESIDFNGNTGPFIQYTHARIKSLLKKAQAQGVSFTETKSNTLMTLESELAHSLYEFPQMIETAAVQFSPAMIANYIFELSKLFNQFYQETPILKEEDNAKRGFRLQLASLTAQVIKTGMELLGIEVPERM